MHIVARWRGCGGGERVPSSPVRGARDSVIARLCRAPSSIGRPSPGGFGPQQPQPLHTLTRTLYGPLYDPLSGHPLRRSRVRR
jgi:hypothetical protein